MNPQTVRPWIAQMGSQDVGRAGWYRYDCFDNAGVGSANRLLPAVRAPAVGDARAAKPDFAWTVQAIEPGRSLVLDCVPVIASCVRTSAGRS